jgi:DNA mismatch repair ATPase MutS
MAFDRESLTPLYRLEIGEAGESCALYIAEKLGMPPHMLQRARKAAYGSLREEERPSPEQAAHGSGASAMTPRIVRQKEQKTEGQPLSEQFRIGDSVMVYPQKQIGIVYARSNENGKSEFR